MHTFKPGDRVRIKVEASHTWGGRLGRVTERSERVSAVVWVRLDQDGTLPFLDDELEQVVELGREAMAA